MFEFLTDIPVFRDLNEEEEALLARHAIRRILPKKCVVLLEGMDTSAFGLLLRGEAKSVWFEEEGREVLLHYYGPGDIIGEAAVISLAPATHSLVTLEESEFLLFPREAVGELCRANGSLALAILSQVLRQKSRGEYRIRYLSRPSARDKISGYLREIGRQFGVRERNRIRVRQTLSHREIADACSLTRETVTRTLPLLEESGISVDTNGDWVILDSSSGA